MGAPPWLPGIVCMFAHSILELQLYMDELRRILVVGVAREQSHI